MSRTTVLDHPLVASRYFFPRPAIVPEPFWVDVADGSKLACYYRNTNPHAKTVVYFHGNGEVITDYLPDFPNWFSQAGYNVLLAEYRGYGMSTGRPALAGMLDDVERIIQSLGVPDDRMVLFGRSLGSLYALHGICKRPQLAGLIIESGIAEIGERFFMRLQPEELGLSMTALGEELKHYFDYAQKLRVFDGRALIMHTRFDELVPCHHAEHLYAAAKEPTQLTIFDRGGHNDIFFRNQEAYLSLVETFLAQP